VELSTLGLAAVGSAALVFCPRAILLAGRRGWALALLGTRVRAYVPARAAAAAGRGVGIIAVAPAPAAAALLGGLSRALEQAPVQCVAYKRKGG
jgi:hypothetical protein